MYNDRASHKHNAAQAPQLAVMVSAITLCNFKHYENDLFSIDTERNLV